MPRKIPLKGDNKARAFVLAGIAMEVMKWQDSDGRQDRIWAGDLVIVVPRESIVWPIRIVFGDGREAEIDFRGKHGG